MKKAIALLLSLSLLLLFALSACGPKEAADDETPTAPVSDATATPPSPTSGPDVTPDNSPRPEIHLAVLSGPTGVGAAQLMAQNDAGNTINDYHVTVETDNSAVTTKLVNGEYDIAALATNVASNLYHKTNGGVQLAAINTLGVLYIMGKGVDDSMNALADLRGKTLYATGQGANPEYVLDYLLTENGLDPDRDVDIQWMAADEVTAAMLSAEGYAYCMLPVPAATALQAKSEGNVQPLFSLSEQWDALDNGSQLTMGCVVVRTEFAQKNPEAVKTFLAEYAQSISYVRDNPAEASEWVAQYGITPSAGIAQKAIPQCNLVCVTGEDMRDAIQGYYEVLFKADPASIGGSIPDDAFYFLGN